MLFFVLVRCLLCCPWMVRRKSGWGSASCLLFLVVCVLALMICLAACDHLCRKKDTTHRPETKTQQRRRGEGQAIQHVARIVRYDRPVMGLWISHVGPLFFSNEIPANVGQNKPFPKTSLAQMTCLTIVCVCF